MPCKIAPMDSLLACYEGKLVYVANIRVPSEKAHVLQSFKMCEAFRRLGLDVELTYPRRRNTSAMEGVDALSYYDVECPFRLVETNCPDLLRLSANPRIQMMLFVAHATLFTIESVRRRWDGNPLLYTRDMFVALGLALAGRAFVMELHSLPDRGPTRRWLKIVSRAATAIVVINRHLVEDCVALGAPRELFFVAPTAVDARLLTPRMDRQKARRALALDTDEPVAGYTGHLYSWKGIDTVMACAEKMPDVTFLVVGGTTEDVSRLRQRVEAQELSNVRIEDHVPPVRVPTYLAASDVLLLPNSANARISARYTSPLKAFEYMASERPVVASDLPSLGELFEDGRNALLVRPDCPDDLARGIRQILEDPALAQRLSAAGRESVRSRTWDQRAAAILEFVYLRGAPVQRSHWAPVECGATR